MSGKQQHLTFINCMRPELCSHFNTAKLKKNLLTEGDT